MLLSIKTHTHTHTADMAHAVTTEVEIKFSAMNKIKMKWFNTAYMSTHSTCTNFVSSVKCKEVAYNIHKQLTNHMLF